MTKNRLSSADGVGFIRAFTDQWADLEAEYGVLVTLRVSPAKRKGILEHRMSCWREEERRGSHPQAAYTFEYPTAQVATYEAALFQAMCRLARILEQQRRWPAGKG